MDREGFGIKEYGAISVDEAVSRMTQAEELAISVATSNGLYPWGGSNESLDINNVVWKVLCEVRQREAFCSVFCRDGERSVVERAELEAAMEAYGVTRALGGEDYPASENSVTTIGLRGAIAELLAPELKADLEGIESELEKRLSKLAVAIAESQLSNQVLSKVNWRRIGRSFIRNGETISAITEVYSMIWNVFQGTPGEGKLETAGAFIEDLFAKSMEEDRVSLRKLRRVVRCSGIRESSDNVQFRRLINTLIGGINRYRDDCLTVEKVVELRAALDRCSGLSNTKKGKAEVIMVALEEKYPVPDEEKRPELRGLLVCMGDTDGSDLDAVGYSGELVNLAVDLARIRELLMVVAGVVGGVVVVGVPGAVLTAEAVLESTAIGGFRVFGEFWNRVVAMEEVAQRWAIRRSYNRGILARIKEWTFFTRQCCDAISSAATNLDDGWTVVGDESRLVKTVSVQFGPGSKKTVEVTISRNVDRDDSGMITCDVDLSVVFNNRNGETLSRNVKLYISVNGESLFIGSTGNRPVFMGGSGIYEMAYRGVRIGYKNGERATIPWSMKDYVVHELGVEMAVRQDYTNHAKESYKNAGRRNKEWYALRYINACNAYEDMCNSYVRLASSVNYTLERSLLESLGRYRGMCVNDFYAALLKVVYPSLKRLRELDESEQQRWLTISSHHQQLMIGLSLLSDILDFPNSGLLAKKMNGLNEVGFLDKFVDDPEVLDIVNQTLLSLGTFVFTEDISFRRAFLEKVITMAGVIFSAYDGKALPISVVPTMGLSGHQDGEGQISMPGSHVNVWGNGLTARKIASGLMNMNNSGYPAVLGGSLAGQNIGNEQILKAFKQR